MPHMKQPVMWELPHWMMWLGGVLEEQGYHNLDVIDLYTSVHALNGTSAIDEHYVRGVLRTHGGAGVYLFSPMTPNNHLAIAIARIVKDLYPQSKTIFGGVMSTPAHETTAREPAVDFVVRGRGEVALPALLHALEHDRDLQSVGQLTYEDGGTVRYNPLVYPDVLPAHLPKDKIDLFPPEAGEHIRYIRQVYGLGCPYRCSFCTIQTIGQRQHYFPVARVLDEMDAYRDRFGEQHHFYMGDETFTMSDGPTLTLLDAFAARGDISFDAQTRLNRLTNPEIITALGEGGCKWLEIGIETSVEDTSERFKQHTKLDGLLGTLSRLGDAGVAVCSFMVNGFPGQTLDTMKKSVEQIATLIDDGYLQASYFAQLVPYPGSEIYENPDKFGMQLLHKDFSRYHEDLPPVYTTAEAPDPEEVHEVYRQGLMTLGAAMSRSVPTASGDSWNEYGTFWKGPHV
jgi:anaerobic magnesium-protoporphyrin IX monomethyl ester cyclase